MQLEDKEEDGKEKATKYIVEAQRYCGGILDASSHS